jgi:glycosyltransferase involved in cell wall biosynthesis
MAPAAVTSILLVANTDWYLFNHRLSLAMQLRRQGAQVHLASPGGPFAGRMRQAGFDWHEIQMDRKGFNPFREARTLRRLGDLYARVKPTLVHHFTIKPVLYGSLEGRWRKVPALVNSITGRGYVFAGRGLVPWLLRSFLRPVFAYALDSANQKVIFQHPADLQSFLSMGLVRQERCAVIRGSGIDPQRFRPRPEPAGDPVVLMPSRMLKDKGVQDLVQASRLLKRRGVRLRVVLAGDPDPGNPTSIPEKQLRGWTAEGVVEWAGRSEDMVETYASAHIVVLPSHAEGVPRALIEGAAMAKPIVATDLPGCREIVYNGRNGLLVPARDPQALSEAIETLVKDPQLRSRMGAEGRAIALENYTNDIVNGMILRVYNGLLAQAGLPGIAEGAT